MPVISLPNLCLISASTWLSLCANRATPCCLYAHDSCVHWRAHNSEPCLFASHALLGCSLLPPSPWMLSSPTCSMLSVDVLLWLCTQLASEVTSMEAQQAALQAALEGEKAKTAEVAGELEQMLGGGDAGIERKLKASRRQVSRLEERFAEALVRLREVLQAHDARAAENEILIGSMGDLRKVFEEAQKEVERTKDECDARLLQGKHEASARVGGISNMIIEARDMLAERDEALRVMQSELL